MDCPEIQDILSARHDSGLVDAVELDQALAHCDSCDDCAAFARALAVLDTIPRPRLSDRALRQTLDAVEAVRSEPQTEDVAVLEEALLAAKPRAAQRVSFTVSIPRPALIASAAVVFVAAVFIAVRVMSAGLPANDLAAESESATDDFAADAPAESPATSPLLSADADEEAGGVSRVVGDAPDYVQYLGRVYRVQPELTEVEVEAAPIGSVSTAKGDPALPALLYNVHLDANGNLYLEGSVADGYAPLEALTRTFEGRTYVMTTDTTIDAYGVWPALPSYVPEPLEADGSPIFAEAGEDAHGATVYVRQGQSTLEGIAVPPDMPRSDPAGGNPNWTWWTPSS